MLHFGKKCWNLKWLFGGMAKTNKAIFSLNQMFYGSYDKDMI